LKSIFSYCQRHLWPAITWTLLILIACTWPGKDLPDAPVVGFDKIVHAGLFIGWTGLWLLAVPKKYSMILVIGIGYGIFLEFYQQWLPFDRTFDWWDAAADGLGVFLGALLYWLFTKMRLINHQ
jgi:hypothetical protein